MIGLPPTGVAESLAVGLVAAFVGSVLTHCLRMCNHTPRPFLTGRVGCPPPSNSRIAPCNSQDEPRIPKGCPVCGPSVLTLWQAPLTADNDTCGSQDGHKALVFRGSFNEIAQHN